MKEKDIETLQHTTWRCQYHIVFAPKYRWPTHSWPLEGRCPYYALLGLTQAPGLAGGPDYLGIEFSGVQCCRFAPGSPQLAAWASGCFRGCVRACRGTSQCATQRICAE